MIAVKYDTVSIGEAARLTGASIKQIRSWSDKGYLPELERVICGERSYRHFREADLEIIKAIKGYLVEGFTLKAAALKIKTPKKRR